MRKQLLHILYILFIINNCYTQNLVVFDSMCNNYIKGTVELATPKQVNRKRNITSVVFLDARETKEYNISHIKGAINVGYNNFSISSVNDIDKNQHIYVYCSIGYRSEKIGEKLQKAGFKKVYNLYGGIFNWANFGYELLDQNEKPTTKVHGYNKKWSQWLNEKKCTRIVN